MKEKFLFTKPILKPEDVNDGTRVSVMSLHTENDGKTPDARIIEGETFKEWAREFSPPLKLVGAYYRGEVDWREYEIRYLEFLRSDDMRGRVRDFAKRCLGEIITLMYIEDDPEKCHRRLLAEELKRYEPDLNIIHK